MGAAIAFWILLTLHFNGEIQTASFQPWAMDELLSDVVDPSSLLFSSTADAMVTCVLRCSQESGCALAGFSATLGICDLYSVYPDLEKALPQASTQFYRLRMTSTECERAGYTYVSSAEACVKLYTDRAYFTDARTMCQSEGGDLVKVSTDKLLTYLETTLDSNQRYWVGAIQTPGDVSSWFWVDGSPVSPAIWSNGEPNGVNDECMEFRFFTPGRVYVNDNPCSAQKYYICEKFV